MWWIWGLLVSLAVLYGVHCDTKNRPAHLRAFLEALPHPKRNLSSLAVFPEHLVGHSYRVSGLCNTRSDQVLHSGSPSPPLHRRPEDTLFRHCRHAGICCWLLWSGKFINNNEVTVIVNKSWLADLFQKIHIAVNNTIYI